MNHLSYRNGVAYVVGFVRNAPYRSSEPEPCEALDRPLAEPLEDDLPILATRVVEGRRVQFVLIPNRPKFRLTFTDCHPALLGHITGLGSPTPELRVADPLHSDWARAEGTATAIRDIACFTWHHRTRLLEECLHDR